MSGCDLHKTTRRPLALRDLVAWGFRGMSTKTTEYLRGDDLDLIAITDVDDLSYLVRRFAHETGVRIGAHDQGHSAPQASCQDRMVKPTHRPIDRMSVARLVACDSASDVAGWVIDRLMAKVVRGDLHAGDTIEAMQVYRRAEELLRGETSS